MNEFMFAMFSKNEPKIKITLGFLVCDVYGMGFEMNNVYWM
jgi:hypothetical protein